MQVGGSGNCGVEASIEQKRTARLRDTATLPPGPFHSPPRARTRPTTRSRRGSAGSSAGRSPAVKLSMRALRDSDVALEDGQPPGRAPPPVAEVEEAEERQPRRGERWFGVARSA